MDIEEIREIISRGKIINKKECYALYEIGYFGNKALTWNSFEEIVGSGWKDSVCMRSKKGVDRKRVDYNVPLLEVPKKIKEWKNEGFKEETITFNQSMPDEHLILQGEVVDYVGGFHACYTKVKKPMNLALSEEYLICKGLAAKDLLRRKLDGPSYDNLERLFETFPTAAVEFSSYSTSVGNLGHNTVFWEVRDY